MSQARDGLADFALFYDRHCAAVLSFFTRRTWDAQLAMDLTSETFAQALAGRGAFRGSSPQQLEAWLYSIAHHQLSHYFRKARAERSAIGRLGLQAPAVSAEDAQRIEQLAELAPLREAVAEHVSQMPGDQRELLTLRVVEGLSYREIALRLGISEQVSRKRVSRALQKLLTALEHTTIPSEVS